MQDNKDLLEMKDLTQFTKNELHYILYQVLKIDHHMTPF